MWLVPPGIPRITCSVKLLETNIPSACPPACFPSSSPRLVSPRERILLVQTGERYPTIQPRVCFLLCYFGDECHQRFAGVLRIVGELFSRWLPSLLSPTMGAKTRAAWIVFATHRNNSQILQSLITFVGWDAGISAWSVRNGVRRAQHLPRQMQMFISPSNHPQWFLNRCYLFRHRHFCIAMFWGFNLGSILSHLSGSWSVVRGVSKPSPRLAIRPTFSKSL